MAELTNLQDLLEDLVKDTYDAENQLLEALPKLAKAAKSSDLKKAIKNHQAETKVHVERLEEAFAILEMPVKGKKCKGMAGLLKEAQEAMEEEGKPALVDACMIASAQKAEHYEISAYGTMRTYAELLGKADLVSLFEATLKEEKNADSLLTEISQGELLRKSLPKK